MPSIGSKSKFFCQRFHLDVEGGAIAHAEPVLAMDDVKAAGDDDGRADERPPIGNWLKTIQPAMIIQIICE